MSPSRPASPVAVVEAVEETESTRCESIPSFAVRSSTRPSMPRGSFCSESAASARFSSGSAAGSTDRRRSATAASVRPLAASSSRRSCESSPSLAASPAAVVETVFATVSTRSATTSTLFVTRSSNFGSRFESASIVRRSSLRAFSSDAVGIARSCPSMSSTRARRVSARSESGTAPSGWARGRWRRYAIPGARALRGRLEVRTPQEQSRGGRRVGISLDASSAESTEAADMLLRRIGVRRVSLAHPTQGVVVTGRLASPEPSSAVRASVGNRGLGRRRFARGLREGRPRVARASSRRRRPCVRIPPSSARRRARLLGAPHRSHRASQRAGRVSARKSRGWTSAHAGRAAIRGSRRERARRPA